MKHLDIHKILTDSQHGFRARRSCETQLLETLDDITKMAANNKQIDIILLDFSKAFDKSAAQKTVKQAKLLWHSQQHTAMDLLIPT